MATRIIRAGVLTGALALALSGCAPTARSTRPVVAGVAMPVVDARASSQSIPKMGSLLVTSCSYGIQRAGDKAADPLPMRYLQEYVSTAFKARTGDKVTVHRLEIYYNMQASLRHQTFTAFTGLIPAMMAGSACWAPADTAGYVDFAREDAEGRPAVVVYLDADFRGQHLSARAVRVADARPHGLPVFAAMDAALTEAFGRPWPNK